MVKSLVYIDYFGQKDDTVVMLGLTVTVKLQLVEATQGLYAMPP